jgi:transposase-like protein
MAANEPSDKPTDYTPETCALVAKLMGSGHSLTGAAGAMGVSPETLRRWMDTHEEFRDAVSRGKAARVYALERRMLASENTAVVNACRFALINAAPGEWQAKPVVPEETGESPIQQLARQLSGNAIRPRLPEANVIEQNPVAPRALGSQQTVTIDDGDDDKPRFHTISRESYEEEESGDV